MQISRFIASKRNVLFMLMVVFVSLGIQGYSGLEDEQNPYSGHFIWRLKRKSQISCHCCSHSFNSHCCLQCMNRLRIGKRTQAASDDISEWAVIDDDLDEDENLAEDNMQRQNYLIDLANQVQTCSCCLRVVNREPFPQRWPCCRKCQNLSDALTKSEMNSGNHV